MQGCGPEAFGCPANDTITVGPLAAALQSTITQAYRLAVEHHESTVTLLAKAAELIERAHHHGGTQIDARLKNIRDAAQPAAVLRLSDTLAELVSVSTPPTLAP